MSPFRILVDIIGNLIWVALAAFMLVETKLNDGWLLAQILWTINIVLAGFKARANAIHYNHAREVKVISDRALNTIKRDTTPTYKKGCPKCGVEVVVKGTLCVDCLGKVLRARESKQ